MKIPGVWKILSKFLYTRMFSLKKNMLKKWTLVENFCEQLDERFFRSICYIKNECYPEKILRQTARKNFQLEFIFFPQRIIISVKKKKKNRTLVENFCEQLDKRFFRGICYIKNDWYPEKILRQTARKNFQLEFIFSKFSHFTKEMMLLQFWTLVENFCEQLDKRFFRGICYIKNDWYPEKILRQTARKNFQLEFIFSKFSPLAKKMMKILTFSKKK